MISIHAPRVGGDQFSTLEPYVEKVFQSTPPVWGATRLKLAWKLFYAISIHAPRVGGDSKSAQISLSLLFKAENISRFVLL